MRNIERISEELGENYHQMQHFIAESKYLNIFSEIKLNYFSTKQKNLSWNSHNRHDLLLTYHEMLFF